MDKEIAKIRNYYYEVLPSGERTSFRERVMGAFGWSYPTFYHKFSKGNFSMAESKLLILIIDGKLKDVI